MKYFIAAGFAFVFCLFSATVIGGPRQPSTDSLVIHATNPMAMTRIDEAISVPVALILAKAPTFDPRSCTVYSGGIEIPSQIDDSNRDGAPDLLTLVTEFAPNEVKAIVLHWGNEAAPKKNYKKRTQADMSIKVDYEFVDGKYTKGRYVTIDSVRVPALHADHDALFRHEGPAWESDKIGYRFYLDARNRTDIFGKKVTDMVLNTAGVHDLAADNNESYESMLDWGMDTFKVGTSLGIGSVAMQSGADVVTVSNTDSVFCVIAANGPVRSDVRATYYGWNVAGKKYDLISSYSITAGSRLTLCDEKISPSSSNLCTGLAKHDSTILIESAGRLDKGWQYFGLFGKQSRAGDDMGIALFYKGSEKIERTSDSVSQLVVLRPHEGQLKYYFAAAWQQEQNGITTIDEFRSYLESVIEKLNNPILVIF
ncbi:MAG: DUF4861 domain-containing protein [Bacteroidota bacterium]